MTDKISSSVADSATNARGRWTPGPWEYTRESTGGWRKITAKDEYILAMVSGRAYRGQAGLADAALIAAAPELLAASEAGVIAERAYNNYKIDPRLENLTNWRKLADQAQRMRRIAIAKAQP